MKPFSLAFEKAFNREEALVADKTSTPLRQRRKLWEMPSSWHCTLIGTCLSVADMRQLMKFSTDDSHIINDYGLHSYIVNHCDTRNALAEAIHRLLNQRHAAVLRRFARLKNGDAVLTAWKMAFAAGDVAGSLWAAWTHGDLGEYEGSVIYGDLHMLAHQLCAQARPSQTRLAELEKDNGIQYAEILRLRQSLATIRNECAQREAELERQLAELTGQLSCARQAATHLAELEQAQLQHRALLDRNALLSRRLATLEKRNQEQQNRITELENELSRVRKLDALLASPVQTEPSEASRSLGLTEKPADIQLDGRRILCIGGRPGLIAHYRQLVEMHGGRFIHHDGGQKDNEHRIDAIVAGADVIFCQVGYLSHPSYWRIKEVCKQRGLPCLFQKSGGIKTFSRDLKRIAEESWRPGIAGSPPLAAARMEIST